jgi:hypothetical protein
VRQRGANLLGSLPEGVARTMIRESMPRVAFHSITPREDPMAKKAKKAAKKTAKKTKKAKKK